LANLAHTLRLKGQQRQAAGLFDESAVLARQLGDAGTLGFALSNLGVIAHVEGNDAQAVACLEEALALARQRDDSISIAWYLAYLGRVVKDQEDGGRAATLLAESLARFRDVGNRDGIAFTMELFAGLTVREEHGSAAAARAARLFGAANALREAIGSPLAPFDQPTYDDDVQAARARLDNDAWESAWAEGQAMTLEQAIAYALEEH
jgi:non-specific serine/threonine protein kinase